jgi:hypothetical protein
MMIPQRLSTEPSSNTTPSPARLRTPSLALCLAGLLSVVACKGSFDENEPRSSTLPNGAGIPGSNAGAAPGASATTRTPTAETSPSGDGERVGDNISGLDNENASDDRRGGGTRRRASDRDRDDDDDDDNEDVDAGVEEPEDAGVLEDAGLVDGGVVDGGAPGERLMSCCAQALPGIGSLPWRVGMGATMGGVSPLTRSAMFTA